MSVNKLLEKIDFYLGEEKDSEIDWDQVKKAGKDAQKDIHGKVDDEIINGMVNKIKKDGEAKDTEDAIQIIVNMLKS